MWKIISTVVAVVFLVGAGAIVWDGHQTADDAAKLRKQAVVLDAQASAAHDKAAAQSAAATKLDTRADGIRRAVDDMRSKADSIAKSVGLVNDAQNQAVDTINPVVNEYPSAATRATLDEILRNLATHTTAATTDAEAIRSSAETLTKVAK